MERKEIERALQGLSRPAVTAFAVRVGLRALPLLASRPKVGKWGFCVGTQMYSRATFWRYFGLIMLVF